MAVNSSINNGNTNITTLGTITTGTWNSDIISPQYGGTGVNNGIFTLRLAGTFQTSGANPLTLTTVATTNVTLPPSGTLVNTAVTTLSSLASIGTITTGTWNASNILPGFGGTGVSNPTAHAIPIAEGSSNFNFLTLSAGQILIGTTAGDPTPATLTAGTGINISSVSGGITISSTGEVPYTEVTGTSQAMVQDNEYTANNAGLVTLTLPATATVGSKLQVNWKGAGGWKIAQNSGQQIQLGNVTTTSGAGGSISSSASGDCVQLVCITANVLFEVQNVQGNLNYV